MGDDPQPRPSDLLIHEQHDLSLIEAPDGDGLFHPDGSIDMVLVRPCSGRGPGGRIYEADVLAHEAHTFAGLSMFDNHDSPVARKARAGLPRSPSDLAGVIRESRWDPEYTTPEDDKFGFGKGAVIGRCTLTDTMEALVRKIPEAVKGSLNTAASSMRMGSRGGKKGWIVEGFNNDPEQSSFDLVTRAGAGGRVASVLEALHNSGSASDELSIAESVTDDELVSWLREHRPQVLTSEGGADPMNLQEALQSDEVQGWIDTKISEAVETQVEAKVAEREGELREEIRDELGKTSRMRGLHAEATRIIEASKLPATAKANLLEDYGLTEEDDDTITPARSLALIEAVTDDHGKVTKSAKEVLKDSIEEDVKRVRNVIREAAPTVPHAPGGGAGSGATGATFGGEGSNWARKMRERGLDPSQFGAPKPAETTTT